MTDARIAAIEAALGFPLPGEYRRVAAAPPFRPIGLGSVYWFFDDPADVIEETRAPLADGGYDMAGWREGYLTIGENGAGDLYVMDTAAPGLPVHLLSHESHAIEPEFGSFAAFVEDWARAPEAFEAHVAGERARERADWNLRLRRTAIFVCCFIPASAVFAAIVVQVVLWLRT